MIYKNSFYFYIQPQNNCLKKIFKYHIVFNMTAHLIYYYLSAGYITFEVNATEYLLQWRPFSSVIVK